MCDKAQAEWLQHKCIIPKISAPCRQISGRIGPMVGAEDKIVVYQNPTCSKCRSTIKILRDRGADFEAVNYYEVPLDAGELDGLIARLGIPVSELLRKDEQIYRDLKLGQSQLSDAELVDLMVRHPDLIQRPIVVRGDRAILGRPPETVEEIL
jgi:arsenate reductase